MPRKAGVWIDHKQATIVLLSDAGQEIKKIAFDIGQPIHKPGGGRSKNTFTRNDFVADDRLERKVASDRKDYYGDVLVALRGVSTVLIVGPGEAKGELIKQIKATKVRGLAVDSATADKMTDRQFAAQVRQHFAAAPVESAKPPGAKAKKTASGNVKTNSVGNAEAPKNVTRAASHKGAKKVRN